MLNIIINNKKRNMKKFFMIAVMAVVALTANAQKGEYFVTPHVGFGYISSQKIPTSHFGMDDYVREGLGFQVGVDAEYMVADNVGLSAGVDFLYAKTDALEFTNGLGDKLTVYADYSYINIPLLAQYHVGHFAIKAGLQPSISLGGNWKDGDEKESLDDLKSVGFSVPVGVSYKFNSPLVLDLRYSIPMTKQFEHGNNKFASVILTLGYSF